MVDGDLLLKNKAFPVSFQLLKLPSGFDAIMGMDLLTKYNVRTLCRARKILIDDPAGKPMVVACCGYMSHGLPKANEAMDWQRQSLQAGLFYIAPKAPSNPWGLLDDTCPVETVDTEQYDAIWVSKRGIL
eukprot:SAG22_NODE_4025_length_1417_cov_1.836874_2_plen_130_part_00